MSTLLTVATVIGLLILACLALIAAGLASLFAAICLWKWWEA